jgi:hypothetical protein
MSSKHLSIAVQVKPIPRIPSRHDLADLSSTLGPMSVIYLFKNFAYIYIQVRLNLLRCNMPSRAIGSCDPMYIDVTAKALCPPPAADSNGAGTTQAGSPPAAVQSVVPHQLPDRSSRTGAPCVCMHIA